MKKKLEEYRQMETAQLEQKVLELKSELAKERAAIASGTRAEKPAKIRNLRRQIARMLTIINSKKKR